MDRAGICLSFLLLVSSDFSRFGLLSLLPDMSVSPHLTVSP